MNIDIKQNIPEELSHLTLMTKSNMKSFIATLSDAFAGYPQIDLILGSKAAQGTLRTFWNAVLHAQKPDTFILADSPDVHGVLIVSKAQDAGTKTLPFLLNGGIKLLPHIPIILSYETYTEKIQNKHIGKDTWYIFTFAVEKSFQGKHIASALMRPFLDFLDRTGSSCYLETHNAKNVPIYEHYGFSVIETGTVPHSSLTHYAMMRNRQ